MKNSIILFCSLLLATNCSGEIKLNIPEVNTLDTIGTVDFEALNGVKAAVAVKQEPYFSAFTSLQAAADKALAKPLVSVVQKTQTPPSGHKHDYLSLAPYWWPDPNKVDGLPWIRKDGQVNPLTRGNNVDEPAKDSMFGNVKILATAFYFTENPKYADRAEQILKTWFLEKETKMNPNLNFGQGVPGVSTGRGFGLIEFAATAELIPSLELLQKNNGISPETYAGIQNWYKEFVEWMETSKIGREEKNTKNNHGTWYDVQRVITYLFIGNTPKALEVLESVKSQRIDTQIAADGSQPEELARTKSLSYSTMNLKAFTYLAFYAKKLNVDLFTYKNSKGGSISKAYDFLKPYVNGAKSWEYQQLGGVESALEGTIELFVFAASKMGISENCKYLGKMKSKTDIDILLNPCL